MCGYGAESSSVTGHLVLEQVDHDADSQERPVHAPGIGGRSGAIALSRLGLIPVEHLMIQIQIRGTGLGFAVVQVRIQV